MRQVFQTKLEIALGTNDTSASIAVGGFQHQVLQRGAPSKKLHHVIVAPEQNPVPHVQSPQQRQAHGERGERVEEHAVELHG